MAQDGYEKLSSSHYEKKKVAPCDKWTRKQKGDKDVEI